MPDLFDPEYNRLSKDLEDAFPREEAFPSEEETPREVFSRADEYNENAPAFFPRAKTDQHKKVKSRFLRPLTGVIVGAAVLFASIGFDPLGLDLFGGKSAPASPSPAPTETVKKPAAKDPNASSSFPKLPNQDPDDGSFLVGGAAQNYLYLSQPALHTVTFFSNSDVQKASGVYASFQSAGFTIRETNAADGISYDSATNTVTLKNFDDPGALLDANLMGNGFTVRLEGKNRIGQIKTWGWGYGASLTITGTGSLTVNENLGNMVGLFLKAENNVPAGQEEGQPLRLESETCLMIDSSVEFVEAYGAQTAFAVDGHSAAEKGLYYLHPLHLYGGVPELYRNEEGKSLGVYTVFGEDGAFATHILFSRVHDDLEHPDDAQVSFTPYAPNESVTVLLWNNDTPWDQKPAALADGETAVNSNYRGKGTVKVYQNGVQNDHYLVLGDTALVRGSACDPSVPPLGKVEGAEYDPEEGPFGTLTLNNFKGGALKMRLMGSITIELAGENELDQIEILNYFSSGNVFFSGSGSLKVNADRKNAKGILLDAQFGTGRLVVLEGVTLDVYGGKEKSVEIAEGTVSDEVSAAIFVKADQLVHPILYFEGVELTGGVRTTGAFEYDYDLLPTAPTNEILNTTVYFHDCTILDEKGVPSLHVRFSPVKNAAADGDKEVPDEINSEKSGEENGKGPRIPVIALIGAVLIILVLALLLTGFLTGKKKKKEE